ncbi:MAG: 6-O-methylguanine DNA methyltransferase [Hyphomicrobiales bacterium]|nr:bifunctional helix-turn-helix domain-containing protein/methylated-DNA--[protein]-cysteine S-methyltransferase [Hyphomicrobiales bacterium]PCJ91527.1 MAG: 6-O-methylguanine DNA methyltransferase [Hyphomicrobiales bacterium]
MNYPIPPIDLAQAQPLNPSDLSASRDYDVVRRIIEFISENYRDQPSLEVLADLVNLSPFHLQKLFTRWAGLSPKGFLQAVTLDHARRLLDGPDSLLDVSYDLGLSGPGRLHDLFVNAEAMSPGIYKSRGDGLTIYYGFHDSPFGLALAMATDRGLAGLAFADEGGEEAAFADMAGRWPRAKYVAAPEKTAGFVKQAFAETTTQQPMRVVLIGTDFEVRVWEALLTIPMGRTTTYSALAGSIDKPKAARAVGAAVGRNPISFVVPCHRVIGKSGSLTGYHWGLTRKRAILGWEAGQTFER